MPRSVPALWLNEMLHCSAAGLSPASTNCCRSNARAKNPRSSDLSSRSMMATPSIGVVMIFMVSGSLAEVVRSKGEASRRPEQVGVDLLRGDEVLELLEPRVAAARERLLVHVDRGEDVVQLLGPAGGVPLAREAGQL